MQSEKAKLLVRVIEARGLKAADIGGSSDPFVEVRLKGQNYGQCTKTIKKTLDPFWNEDFYLNPTANDILSIKVFDYDKIGSNDLLGELEIPASVLLNKGQQEQWYPLFNLSKGTKMPGEIRIFLHHVNQQQQLQQQHQQPTATPYPPQYPSAYPPGVAPFYPPTANAAPLYPYPPPVSNFASPTAFPPFPPQPVPQLYPQITPENNPPTFGIPGVNPIHVPIVVHNEEVTPGFSCHNASNNNNNNPTPSPVTSVISSGPAATVVPDQKWTTNGPMSSTPQTQNGSMMTVKVGGPGYDFVVTPSNVIYGLQPDKQGVWMHEFGQWRKIGGPAHQLAVQGDTLFGISPNGHECHMYNGTTWVKTSDDITQLIGGGAHHMYGVSGNGDVHKYHKEQNRWEKIGGPGHKFIASGDTLIGISPGKGACYAYINNRWTQVGGPIEDLFGAHGKVFGISPSGGDIYEWHCPTPNKWTKIGGPGDHFVVTGDGTLYGVSPGGSQVWRYDGVPLKWTKVASGVEKLIGNGQHPFAIMCQSRDIHALRHT